jgi:hypothetical protein
MEPTAGDQNIDRLRQAIEHNTRIIERWNKMNGDWRVLLWRGLLVGFGGVIGATLVVSIAVKILQPFEWIEGIKPTLERLTREIERN